MSEGNTKGKMITDLEQTLHSVLYCKFHREQANYSGVPGGHTAQVDHPCCSEETARNPDKSLGAALERNLPIPDCRAPRVDPGPQSYIAKCNHKRAALTGVPTYLCTQRVPVSQENRYRGLQDRKATIKDSTTS